MSIGDESAKLVARLIRIGSERDYLDIRYPRASSLYKTCMRMHVLARRHKIKKASSVSLQNRITFGIGDAVHEKVQNTPWIFDDNRIGWWECPCCEKRLHFGVQRKRKCPRCRAETYGLYREYEVGTNRPYTCGGHPDLFLDYQNRLRVVELKTIAVDRFKTLVAPMIEHTWQIQYYMWAIGKDKNFPGKFDKRAGYVVYIAKQEVRNAFPIKIFESPRDKLVLSQIKSKLREYSDAIKSKTLPSMRERCYESDWTTYEAYSCPVVKECKGAA